MSFLDSAGPAALGQGTSGNTDVVIQLQGIVSQLSALVQAFNGRVAFGTFTLAAAATTVIPTTAVKGDSNISWTPTNAAAGTLMGGTKSLYVSAISAGVSFTVATASGVVAAGTETFAYIIVTPI